MRAIDAKHLWLMARFERREGYGRKHYQLTRAFLTRREAILQTLLEED